MHFGTPMKWVQELIHHGDISSTDCYFCAVGPIRGFTKKFKSLITYPEVSSIRKPQAHDDEGVPVPLKNPVEEIATSSKYIIINSLTNVDDSLEN